MTILGHLEPARVLFYFEEFSAIPHGSHNTKGVSDYCVAFAKAHGLEYRQDEDNNVIIKKAGSTGYEQSAPVILQGHLDMVCVKESDCHKDMDNEGLDLFVDGDLIGARGTSLGADNGVAVAMMLAILDGDYPHPPIEAVFTSDEEVGLVGAQRLDASWLAGRRLLNLDSEEEGVLTVSCAGGSRDTCTIPVTREPFSGTALTVTLGGLSGGHSGMEIHKGRGNANQQMGRVLYALSQNTQLRLERVDCVGQDNAIASRTVATIVADGVETIKTAVAEFDGILKHELRLTDAEAFLSVEPAQSKGEPMDKDSTGRVICFLTCAPNGVQGMSGEIAGLVQTSLNMGVVATSDTAVVATFSMRSSVGSEKQMLSQRLAALTEQLGGSVSRSGEYPAWEYRKDSPLRTLMEQVFAQEYGREPTIEAIHAGLECGLFSEKIPELDSVSYGPDLMEVHSPRERMSISSLQRVWLYTLELLKQMK